MAEKERLSQIVMRELEEILEKKAIQNEFETMLNFLKLKETLLRIDAFGGDYLLKEGLISGAEFFGWKMFSESELRLSEEETQIGIFFVILKEIFERLKKKQ